MVAPEQRRKDVDMWITSHALTHPCPSEAGLAPLSAMGTKLIDTYNILVASQPPDEQVLTLLEAV